MSTFKREVRPVDVNQLKDELNASLEITATCINVSKDDSLTGANVTIDWDADLSATEVDMMDAICSSHSPPLNNFSREIRPVDASQLKIELNNSPEISSTCISILEIPDTEFGNNVTIMWNQDLIDSEIIEMDKIISNHTVQVQDLDLAQLPLSDLGDKLSVHGSAKPVQKGKHFYLVWTGAGDDVVNGVIGGGELLHFSNSTANTEVTKIVEFDPKFGDTYIHEGYLKFEGAGEGDEITASIIASASTLQTVANLDLIVQDDWVKMSPTGPGTGTHGFASTPVLLPRSYSKDGDWDYSKESGLVPNLSGTGEYKISTIDRSVHRYINRIPLYGNSYGYTIMTSDETAYLPPNYKLAITLKNLSGNAVHCSIFFEVFREMTSVP